MTFYWNIMAFCVVLSLGVLCEAKLGVDPEMTLEKLKEIIQNKERLSQAKACFNTQTNCTPVQKNLLDAFPEVYKTACANCDEREHQLYQMGCRHVFLQDPIFFKNMVEKMDKDGVYWNSFVKFMLPEY